MAGVTNDLVSHAEHALAGAVGGPRGGAPGGASEAHSPVLRMAQRIQNELVRDADPALFRRLGELQVEPQLYAMRWVRLIFGREFHIEDVIVIWDAILQSSEAEFLRTIEFISASMLLYVREFLLQNEAHQVMRRLMKYPPVEDVHLLLVLLLTREKPEEW